MSEKKSLLFAAIAIIIFFCSLFVAFAQLEQRTYLPAIVRIVRPMQEVRALWVTRFDWTTANGAAPEKIDEIVANAASAGFNVLLFQVRAEADAYYLSSKEPWSRRLSGTLGQDPGWDPLARLVNNAHESGLEVHAYINVYPLWTGCDEPPDNTNPLHFYHRLREIHGETDGKLNGAQQNDSGGMFCEPYVRVSPASIEFDEHLEAVINELVQRYDIDGLHLDHARYADVDSSCDPVTEGRYGAPCFSGSDFADWQRQQINATVSKLYANMVSLKPHIWLTAAVWPVYRDSWDWGVKSGYDSYYQDPKAWMAGEYIDGVSPMIYSGSPNCDRPYFWNLDRWRILVDDYLAGSNGRLIIPGIGTSYCSTDDFAEIVARIEAARNAKTAGHAIFSYHNLLAKDYFDDLATGPYAVPATLPSLSWRSQSEG